MDDRPRHRPETMPGNLRLRVVPHATQRGIYRRVTHWLMWVASGENMLTVARQGVQRPFQVAGGVTFRAAGGDSVAEYLSRFCWYLFCWYAKCQHKYQQIDGISMLCGVMGCHKKKPAIHC
jgi:hypothetical protein